MILMDVNLALGGQQMEWRQLQIAHRIHRPAITAVGLDVQIHRLKPPFKFLLQARRVFVLSRNPFDRRHRRRQRSPRRCSERGVLLPQKLLSLRRPRHQLRVQAHPVRLEFLPEIHGVESGAHVLQ